MNRVSWFNLHHFIPIRDVRKLIYTKLDGGDRIAVSMAHNSTIVFDSSTVFSCHCAKHGYIELLQWARTRGCQWDELTIRIAAQYGRYELFTWMYMEKCPVDLNQTINAAVCGGHIRIIAWLVDIGITFNNRTVFRHATRRGHTNIMQWFHDRGSLTSHDYRGCMCRSAHLGQLASFIWCMKYVTIPPSSVLEWAERGKNAEIIRLARLMNSAH
jgi:hypothetical protein